MGLKWIGEEALSRVREAAEEGVRQGAEVLQSASDSRTPVDSGELIGSSRVSQDGLEAAVSYDTEYARRQHEQLSLKHHGGGQAKFLESAARVEADAIQQAIADRIRGALGG